MIVEIIFEIIIKSFNSDFNCTCQILPSYIKENEERYGFSFKENNNTRDTNMSNNNVMNLRSYH